MNMELNSFCWDIVSTLYTPFYLVKSLLKESDPNKGKFRSEQLPP